MLDWDLVKETSEETGVIAGDIIINSKGDIKTIGDYTSESYTNLLTGNNILNGLIWERTAIFNLYRTDISAAMTYIESLYETNNKIQSIIVSLDTDTNTLIITYTTNNESNLLEVQLSGI
jgi:hypothetical protein